jgi:STE24 endopeptidase
MSNSFAGIVLVLIVARCLAEFWFELLNQNHVRQHAGQIPEAFRDAIDEATYKKSVEYTLARSRFSMAELAWSTVVLVVALFSGILPRFYGGFGESFGHSIWSGAAFLVAAGLALSIPGLPFDWFAQFRLEQKFGFNTSTQKIWWLDRAKGLVLGIALGYPLIAVILKLIGAAGEAWWIWAWAVVFGFQLVMSVLAPILILPLFNKFTPLPEGSLRERLLALGKKTGFHARTIQVMDGSKRSRHSNAFFTGFGRFRKIVLFDTLIAQLAEVELEAVLAHEIGHYKRSHIPKLLALSAAGMLATFFLISVFARQNWFYEAFGFAPGQPAPALLLCTMLSGVAGFWFSPAAYFLSRRYEYEADAFAAATMQGAAPLVGALRKLNEKNLSNLTPHPFYSAFFYSHPTLLERETALRRARPS